MKKLYVASPLGFSEAGKYFLYNKLIPTIQGAGFEVIDPWKLTDERIINTALALPPGQEREDVWRKVNAIIGENNRSAIILSNGLVAVLDGSDVDSGTAGEIGFTCALTGRPILGYKGDFRRGSENEGAIVNLQVEHFIRVSGGDIVSSLEELKPTLYRIFGKPRPRKARKES